MEDTDIKCPFCGSFLTDVDGMLECQEGCYSHSDWQNDKENAWFYKNELLYIFNLYDWLEEAIKKKIDVGFQPYIRQGVYRPGAFIVTSGSFKSEK